MSLTIQDPQVERLAAEVAHLAGETESEAVRRALEERRDRLVPRASAPDRAARLRRFLERDVWPLVPTHALGVSLTTAETDALLGYGPDGV